LQDNTESYEQTLIKILRKKWSLAQEESDYLVNSGVDLDFTADSGSPQILYR